MKRAAAKKKAPAFPPALGDVEAELGPARQWAGRCYEIAVACIDHGFVEGVPVYGHFIGEVNPRSYFGQLKRPTAFVQHGWVLVRGNQNLIFDPTRWAFTNEDPFLYFGPNKGEYDEGGNAWRKATRSPCPAFDPDADRICRINPEQLGSAAWTLVEKLLGPDYDLDLGDEHYPGDVTEEQVFWLANAPYEDLEPHAREIYAAIIAHGQRAAIPIDNYRRAEQRR